MYVSRPTPAFPSFLAWVFFTFFIFSFHLLTMLAVGRAARMHKRYLQLDEGQMKGLTRGGKNQTLRPGS